MFNLSLLKEYLREDLKFLHKQTLNEDVKSSKAFLEKNGISLNNPDFLKIKDEWFPQNPNFVYTFVKFRFGNPPVSMEDLGTLVDSVKRIKLPKPIGQYKNFTDLVDDINTEENKALAKKKDEKVTEFIKGIPRTQYNLIKLFTPEQYEKFLNSVKKLVNDPNYNDDIKKRIEANYAMFETEKEKDEFFDYITKFRISTGDKEFEDIINQINSNQNAELVYSNPENGVIVARLYTFDAAQDLACDTTHCIKNLKSSWNRYNPSPLETAQYYIWLTDKPLSDDNRKIGITVDKNNNYKSNAVQNRNNEDIKSSIGSILDTYGISEYIKYKTPSKKYIIDFIGDSIKQGNIVSDELFDVIYKETDKNDLESYLNKVGGNNLKLPETQFNKLSEKEKLAYIKGKTEKGYRPTDSEFSYAIENNPEILKGYFIDKIKRNEKLNDIEFSYVVNFIPDYIDYVVDYYIKKNDKLTPTQFNLLSRVSTEKATKYIDDNKLIDNLLLSPDQFLFLVKKNKPKAIEYLNNKVDKIINGKTLATLSMTEFGLLSMVNKDMAKKYMDRIIDRKNKKLTQLELQFLINNYDKNTVDSFITKKLTNKIFKDAPLSDEEKEYAKNNNLMEQKFRKLVKKILSEKINYDEIFDDETLNKIKDKSKEDYKDKSMRTSIQDIMSSLPK